MKIRSIFSLRKWTDLLCKQNVSRKIVDKTFLKLQYYACTGNKLNLENPQTFNEKLQWLKLYDRNPEYTIMVDKFASKKYVADKIGKEHVAPLLGGPWYSFDEIDFNSLPEQFVLKTNHDCGGVVLCRDKTNFDKEKTKEFLEKHLKHEYFWAGREWPYKSVKPCIFAEAYMEDFETQELRDYKFFCFDGEVKALFVATDRQTKGEEVKFDFFDAEYNHLAIRNGHPNAKIPPAKPKQFELMKELASKLSLGIPQLRVDFYEVNGKVFFGELTFSHFSGFVPFEPEEWDYTFGSWIELPKQKEEE